MHEKVGPTRPRDSCPCIDSVAAAAPAKGSSSKRSQATQSPGRLLHKSGAVIVVLTRREEIAEGYLHHLSSVTAPCFCLSNPCDGRSCESGKGRRNQRIQPGCLGRRICSPFACTSSRLTSSNKRKRGSSLTLTRSKSKRSDARTASKRGRREEERHTDGQRRERREQQWRRRGKQAANLPPVIARTKGK